MKRKRFKPSPLNEDEVMGINWDEYYRVSNGERRCKRILIGSAVIMGLLLAGLSFSCSADYFDDRKKVIKIDLANGGQLIARPVNPSGWSNNNDYYIDPSEAKDQLGYEFNGGVPAYFDAGTRRNKYR